MTGILALPFTLLLRGMDRLLADAGRTALAWLLLGVAVSWWVYVPLHELFHAWGCQLAGGTVTRLEIDGLYGAAWLARLFPYVTAGSDYAGRLSGFDTDGSDLVYVATVFAPYLLTLLVGVPAFLFTQRRRCAICLGATIPWAYTPFLSLAGDYYELGAIVVSRIAAPWHPEAPLRWRGDDLFQLIDNLGRGPGGLGSADAWGIAAACLLGGAAAFLTFLVGYWLTGIWRPDWITALRDEGTTHAPATPAH
jgi:hypothetical protein